MLAKSDSCQINNRYHFQDCKDSDLSLPKQENTFEYLRNVNKEMALGLNMFNTKSKHKMFALRMQNKSTYVKRET